MAKVSSAEKEKMVREITESQGAGVVKGWFDTLFNPIGGTNMLSSMVKPAKYLIIDTALKDIVYSCIDKRAEAIASLSYKITRGNKGIRPDHPLYRLFRKPNPLFSWYQFIYLVQVYLLSIGEAFIYVSRTKYGRISSLWLLPSQYVTVHYPANSNNIEEITYELDTERFEGLTSKPAFRYNEILYLRKPHPKDIYRGSGILEAALLANDINLYSKQYVSHFYKNGAVPGGVLETEKSLLKPDIDRIKMDWKRKQGTSQNAWEIALLFGGLKYKALTVNPATADFIAQSKWSREDLMALFGVPPVILGYPTNVGAAKEQHELFYKLSVFPDTIKLAEAINVYLFSDTYGLKPYTFSFTNIMPLDIVVQIDKARVGGTFGAITYNELRGFLGLEEMTDSALGDSYVTPLNNPPGSSNTSANSNAVKELLTSINGGINAVN